MEKDIEDRFPDLETVSVMTIDRVPPARLESHWREVTRPMMRVKLLKYTEIF